MWKDITVVMLAAVAMAGAVILLFHMIFSALDERLRRHTEIVRGLRDVNCAINETNRLLDAIRRQGNR